MAHPINRAERRNHRRRIINSALSKTGFLHLFTRWCCCAPLGNYFRTECNLHDPLGGRKTGPFAKTGPYNWINDMEPEWFLSGKLRRDYRAGGGRRGSTGDYGGGLHGAGRFMLSRAITEWETTFNYTPPEWTNNDPGEQIVDTCGAALADSWGYGQPCYLDIAHTGLHRYERGDGFVILWGYE